MKVLVSAASKHGATAEIAAQIGRAMTDLGLAVDLVPPEKVTGVAPYDAVILGSGIYAGRWLESAKALVDRELETLLDRPVWLFSSGPIGEPPMPTAEPSDGVAMRDLVDAIEHRVFAGRLEPSRLAFGERALTKVMRAPEGDFRQWPEVRAWASGIAAILQGSRVPQQVGGQTR